MLKFNQVTNIITWKLHKNFRELYYTWKKDKALTWLTYVSIFRANGHKYIMKKVDIDGYGAEEVPHYLFYLMENIQAQYLGLLYSSSQFNTNSTNL